MMSTSPAPISLGRASSQTVSSRTAQDLRRYGGIARPEEVLQKVDPRIIAGFQAQIEEDESIQPKEREAVLLEMLRDYYLN